MRLHRRVAAAGGPGAADALVLGAGAGVALAGVRATTALCDAVADRDGIARLDVPVLHAAMRLRGAPAAAAALARAFGPVGSPPFPSGRTLDTTAIAAVAACLLTLRERSQAAQAGTAAAAAPPSPPVGFSRVLLGAPVHRRRDGLGGRRAHRRPPAPHRRTRPPKGWGRIGA